MKSLSFSALLAFASLCTVLPAQAQVVQPDPSLPGGFPLKDGAAKPVIQEKCVACHDLRRVVNGNKDAEEWRETVHMMKTAGAPITDDPVKLPSDYFIANHLGLQRAEPAIVPGPVNARLPHL